MAARTAVMRLASLYATMERLRSSELRVAESDVDDAVIAGALAAAAAASHRADARDAMTLGQREEWTIAQTAGIATAARTELLAKLRAEREALRDAALARHRTSRVQMQQMARVVERVEERATVEETRRAQAESDDRFASRQAWQRMKRR